MFKILFLILFIMGSTVFAQQSKNAEQNEKPKSILFDEFGEINQKEIKLRAQKLRKKLQERDSINDGLGAYLIFYSGSNENSLRKTENFIRDILFENCYDCYGFGGPRIVFVDGGKLEKQKIQFWLSPRGAEPPIPEN